MRTNLPTTERKYYNTRNIIDMAEYVVHLATQFNSKAHMNPSTICRSRSSRTFHMAPREDYVTPDQAIAEMGIVSSLVLTSKTKSNIANQYLFSAAHILRQTNAADDPRIAPLMQFSPKT